MCNRRWAPILPVTLLALAAVAQAPPEPDDPIVAAIERARVTADESRWLAIPWLLSLTDAIAHAKETGKPLFLFGYDGVAESGYC
jgi:hypothetical protein